MNTLANDTADYSEGLPLSLAEEPESVTGEIIPTFLKFVGASILGLLALSSAAIVDGVLVGKLLGADALAAVNLLIPLFTFIFGIALMVAIGGSVDAGKYLGAGNKQAASAAFSRSLVAVVVFATLVVGFGYVFSEAVFSLLAVPDALQALVKPYFHIVLLGIPPQLAAVVLYYFLRAAGHPGGASRALVAGALMNIVLDILLLAVFKLDLRAAAWATVAAQVTQCGLLAAFFYSRQNALSWNFTSFSWKHLAVNSANGFSEFVNEVSGGLVLLAIHWLLTNTYGVESVAGFALINYSLLINIMVACAVAEVVHVLVSQNEGAGLHQRALAYRRCGFWAVLTAGGLLSFFVHLSADSLSTWLFNGADAAQYAQEFWPVVAPLFLLTGCNLVLSAWFTGLQQPLHSALIAFSRSLILPLAFMLGIAFFTPHVHFLWALPLAEGVTLFFAVNLIRASFCNKRKTS